MFDGCSVGRGIGDPLAVYWSKADWEMLRPWLERVPLAELARETEIPERTLRSYRMRAPPVEKHQMMGCALLENLN